MNTVESLLTIAMAAEKVYQTRFAMFGPGTVDRERNDAYRTMLRAINYAGWMEQNGLAEHFGVGEFYTNRVAKGQKIKVRKGAKIWTTHPAHRDNFHRVAKVTQTITVFDVSPGFVPDYNEHNGITEGEVICAGGYWCRANLSDIVE